MSSDPVIRVDCRCRIMTPGQAAAWRRLLWQTDRPDLPVAIAHTTNADTFRITLSPLTIAVLAEGDDLVCVRVPVMTQEARRARGLGDIDRFVRKRDTTHATLSGLYTGANMLRGKRVRDMHHFVLPDAVISLPVNAGRAANAPVSLRDCIGHSDDRRDFGRIMVAPGRSAHDRMRIRTTANRAMDLLGRIWPLLYGGTPMPPLEDPWP